MVLQISNNQKFDIYPFLYEWVLPSMKKWIQTSTNIKRLFKFSEFGTPKELYEVLVLMASNLKIYSNIDKTELRIELNQNLNNELNGAKLYSICRAINFGTLNCPAYPIFSDMFEFFANNFWFLFRQYEMGLLKKCL